MSETHISIEQTQRDISNLLEQVAHHGERIVLTSGGKPLAALVSMEDYARLEQVDQRQARWQAWLAESDKLAAEILERRGGEPFYLDAIWQEIKEDQEARDRDLTGLIDLSDLTHTSK